MYTFSVSELMIETKMIVIKNNKDQIDHYQNVGTNIVFSTSFFFFFDGFLEIDKVLRSIHTQNKNQSQLSN